MIFIWCIIPTFTNSSYQSNNLLWFVVLYCAAGYIRLYGLNPRLRCGHYAALFFLFTALTYLSSVVLCVLGAEWSIFAKAVTYFYDQQKITTLLIALCLFMTFATLKMNYHKWINVLASATFGVYLLHDHALMRSFLWLELFKNAQYQSSGRRFIPASIGIVALVYAVCTIIDLLRQYTLEKLYMRLVNRFADRALALCRAACRRLSVWIFGQD